ncbi:MAG: flagellar hook capping FlgD N-terminal domain-containing protein [Usitatibacteraceae bacterium]
MTTINTATSSAITPGSSTTPAIGKDGTEDRFLKLLVAQMKNQDPLNPLDNAQVTSQMAQINTVQGIAQLNTSMVAMLAQFQGAQAITLPGRQVLIDGNTLNLSKSSGTLAANGGFDLALDAERVTVDIKDAKGDIVKHLDLGAQTAGPGSFKWDGALDKGSAAEGKYTFDVKAYNGTVPVTTVALMAARVEGTAITPQGVRLTLENLGSRYYSDVRMVI